MNNFFSGHSFARRLSTSVFPILILTVLLLSACDAERNELIKGLFYTETPIPPTATPTARVLPTLTPLPTETPVPLIEVNTADHYYLTGDFEKAQRLYARTLDAMTDPTQGEDAYINAQLGLARIESLNGDHEACQNRLIEAINATRTTEKKGQMWYQMAECVNRLNLYNEEINALVEYLKAEPESQLAAEIQERIADRFFTLQEYEKAMTIYSGLAETADLQTGNQVWMKVADTFFIQGDYSNALLVWVKIYDANLNEELRVRIDNLMARTYEIIGSQEQAYARYQDAVNNFPRASGSLNALQALIDGEQRVNDYQAGLIYYYRGNYKQATASFYRYLESGEGYDGALYYYLGVSQMYVGNYEEAIGSFEQIIAQFPEDKFYASAWEEKAYVQWYYMGNHQRGAATLLEYVAKHPDQDPAPGYIFQAARVLEIANRITEAAEQWERLIDEYPMYEKSAEALFLAGISRYRTSNYEAAIATFNRSLLVATDTASSAKANYWIAKSYEKKGEKELAEKYYLDASTVSPTDYYTERALDHLAGKTPLTFSARPDYPIDLSSAKEIADQWMRITFAIPDTTDLNGTSRLQPFASFRKANELYRLGRFQAALDAFDTFRTEIAEDPVASYQLLGLLVEYEIYRPAVFISRNILTLAGLIEDMRTLSAPNYFNQIRFGAWYNEEVLAAAKEFGIHSYILYGMMRQESMYDPWIASSAGAQGLMQFMPTTGQEMATKLAWPENYQRTDLQRASVSIRFAGKYLSSQLAFFKGNTFHMLASYNAGAGNTLKWVELDKGDPDLFLEVIRFEETRTYLRHVFENAKMYERLYH